MFVLDTDIYAADYTTDEASSELLSKQPEPSRQPNQSRPLCQI